MPDPVRGFVDQNGATRKYDYESLENIPEDIVHDSDIQSLVAVQDEKPENDLTILWIKKSYSSITRVPTWEEFIISKDNGVSVDARNALLSCLANVPGAKFVPADENDNHYISIGGSSDWDQYYSALQELLFPPPSLSSIRADFVQGSEVFGVNSNINDLKKCLTVTAYYSDGSSKEVTDYTLSGTLSRGESVVAAEYEGESSLFTVNVVTWLITSDDLCIQRLHNNNNSDATGLYPYTDTVVKSRLSYWRFDILLEQDKSYFISADSTASGAQMGVQAFTQDVLDTVNQNGEFPVTAINDTGWRSLSLNYTIPANYIGVRLTFRENTTDPIITDKFISRVVIDEV